MAYDTKLAERMRGVLADREDVVGKEMFGGMAFMVRGHMCCGVIGYSLMVRVAAADHDAIVREPHARPMMFTGRPMRGFIMVDPPGIKTAAALRGWVERAIAYAVTKPAKAAKSAARKPAARRTVNGASARRPKAARRLH